MARYSLQPNEALVLKEERVRHGGTFASYSDELILTNLNLVLVKKGTFGNSKGIRLFPISEVKVYNGQAQALIGQNTTGRAVLEVYFLNGQESFEFQAGSKKKLPAWVAKINQVVTGQEAPPASSGVELAAGVLKDTFGAFKAKLGSKPDAPGQVAAKCNGCGARLSGARGSATTCEYCGTVQQL